MSKENTTVATRPDIPYNAVLCRYGEIALKKQNRSRFERCLQDNIRRAVRDVDGVRVLRIHGRMVMSFRDSRAFTLEEIEEIEQRLPLVFGLTSFSFAISVDAELEAMERVVYGNFPKILAGYGDREVTYRMRARRGNKRFPMKSKDLEIRFADKLLSEYPNLRLNLTEAELSLGLEIRDKLAFVSFDQVECPGGLPAGSSSPALALLSGGIDSPVACYMMMGRGCRVNYLTFHSYPYTTEDLLEKVARLAEVLNRYQAPGRLFACNIAEPQKMIRDNCQERFRTLLYRRLMFRVAEKLAAPLKDEALVTGESVGQVASQTVKNLTVINASTDMLVLRPLLGIDKQKTIDMARKLGTYELSNIQCADSCTVFTPDSPATNARPHLLDFEESKLDLDEMMRLSIEGLTEVMIPSGDQIPVTWFEERPVEEES